MTKSQLLDKWLKVNIELQQAFDELKNLDFIREQIQKKYNQKEEFSYDLTILMDENVKGYEELLAKIKNLKLIAEKIKIQMEKK